MSTPQPPTNHIGDPATSHSSTEAAAPQYRCATYSPTSGPATTQLGGSALAYTIAFSNDSTCASLRQRQQQQQSNATSPPPPSPPPLRIETLQLFAVPPPRWQHDIFCSYPDWMRGRWQHMEIDQSTIVYRDHRSFKTYTMRCVENEIGSERFLAVSRTQW